MIRADVIQLVNENPEAHGVFESVSETTTQVFVEIRSVSMSEQYRALSAGIKPAYVFVLTDYADYADQKIVIYNGKRYRVVRTYVSGQKIEITVEEATADA